MNLDEVRAERQIPKEKTEADRKAKIEAVNKAAREAAEIDTVTTTEPVESPTTVEVKPKKKGKKE